ncbi:TonB-dependent receptor plug domain-containing protein [Rhizobiaceae bacterium BDR2-2]|uniref:TonB-dependent receptor plug domain-containing protein n=1 Tax=Ectorhizobium quercum TaxID=2965071 RepID=A0AAE3N0K8_9HYPH|nr:TonB-dependent receptor plug domain-containing protein [Ectorhizobium quercum]MCX8997916.1 TonB-dependent receptor plug domain-containing protein [Ectorhizobium quercum]
MAQQAGTRFATRIGILLASSGLVLIDAGAHPSYAQTADTGTAAAQSIGFSIPAQGLDTAIRAFIRASGWQIGYPAGLLANKRSQAVSSSLAPRAALEQLLSGTGIGIRMTGVNTVTLVDDTSAGQTDGEGASVLQTIVVNGARGGVGLGSGSLADTGTSTVTGGQIAARAEGNDANGILRNLPNVQYQNDVNDDAGTTDQSVIDLKPREVSISGARVYENNFIVNGMDINTVTGTAERYGSAENLTDSYTPPDAARIFGLHSQSIYVPIDFLEKATVIDSNASARYGNFQGGVVSYELQDASKDRWKGSVSTDYTTSNWTGFKIGTEDGLNPNDVATNDYIKRRASFSLSGPVTDNVAVLGQYSVQTAVTNKDKQYRYTETRRVEENSRNDFYRAQAIAETDWGDFTLEGMYTRYNQDWENANWRNMQVNLATRSLVSKLQHDYAFEDFYLGGVALSNVRLQSKLGYSSSRSLNDMNGNVARAYKQSVVSSRVLRWEATELSDWCRTDPAITINTLCYDGATGDKRQGQERLTWSQELTGDIWQGSFVLGGDYTHTDAYRRRPEDAVYYTNYMSVYEASGISGFVCNTTEECSAEQFANSKAVYQAFDIGAQLNAFNLYAELEQSWDWLNVRGGLRFSYDDYMHNLDIAPRVVATVTPWDDFSISAGFNRYYDAQSLSYAIRDKQPRMQTYIRTRDGAVIDDTWRLLQDTIYANSASDLKTPYTDEITFGLSGTEPLLGGQWRLRFLDRRARDQYASETTGTGAILTNDGRGAYQSVSAEYSRELDVHAKGLEQLFFNASVTWSKREVSNSSYFDDSLDEDYVWYKNRSHTLAGFSVVTGNMDIPLRMQAGLSSTWLDNALQVDLSANYNLGYTGVKYTDQNITVDGRFHQIWEDFDFDPTLTVDLAASYAVYQKEDTNLTLNVRVNNLFNETGNATATVTNPWLIGRTVWVGAKATF